MKRVLIGISLVLIVVATANLIPGQAQEVSAPPRAGNPAASNPLKVAPLKWYAANQVPTIFDAGKEPVGLAFDGANIWAADFGADTVTKLRASDGAKLGTFKVGANPYSVAFDGAHIWVTNSYSNDVTKLRASDGKNLGTFAVGKSPLMIAFDGTSIWVGSTNAVSKFQVSDGKILGTFPLPGASGLAFDGTYMWVACWGNANSPGTAVKMKTDGTIVGSYPVGLQPWGVAFDGANIWVANMGAGTVSKLRASDGASLGTFNLNASAYYVAFDGTNIWVTTGAAVWELRDSDGARLGEFFGGDEGLAFDGAYMWTASFSSDSVFKL
jgi:DNA-binding beta-propeller fold protein YncE